MPVIDDFPDDPIKKVVIKPVVKIEPTVKEINRIVKLMDLIKIPWPFEKFIKTYKEYHKKPAYYKNDKVMWYHTVKVRDYIENFQKRYGYPMRWDSKVDFYDLAYLIIKNDQVILKKRTKDYYNQNPEMLYRNVYIGWQPEQNTEMSIGVSLLNMMTFGIADDVFAGFISKLYPVFENLAFTGTFHDILIYCNWDKIIKLFSTVR